MEARLSVGREPRAFGGGGAIGHWAFLRDWGDVYSCSGQTWLRIIALAAASVQSFMSVLRRFCMPSGILAGRSHTDLYVCMCMYVPL